MSQVIMVVFLSIGLLLDAQQQDSYTGRLIDAENSNPISFATIKLKNQWRGVITNTVGDFQLPRLSININDTMVISCIGYNSKLLPVSELSTEHITLIQLQPSVTQLSEVVVQASKLKQPTGHGIVKQAIKSIATNYPQSDYSYVAYYRDYQLKNNEYINLNEAIVEILDRGFKTESNISSSIKLYQYRKNTDFLRDSLTAVAYDNLDVKFVPNSELYNFGGNELSILLMHDAIRNNQIKTYSFVYKLSRNFLVNHHFRLKQLVKLDNKELYEIEFNLRKGRVFHMGHFARGSIYIEPDNYAIHKLDYSTYSQHPSDKSKLGLLFSIKVEYSQVDSLMYPNYISFHNLFKVKNPKDFKVADILFDKERYRFKIEFNNIPEEASVLNTENYSLKFSGKRMEINEIIYRPETNPKLVYLNLERNEKVNTRVTNQTLADQIKVEFGDIRDIDGRKLGQENHIEANQFRELFVQKVWPGSSEADSLVFIDNNQPLAQNIIHPAIVSSNYFMNTPLKKLLE